MKNILITGGAGFIGSNFIKLVLTNRSYHVFNLDALTYAGNLENLKEIENYPNYTFIKGDICNKNLVDKIFSNYDIEGVIHFAAESHVDRSLIHPQLFLQVNALGTQILLESARKHWLINPNNPQDLRYKTGVKYLQISTDEVYGSLGETGKFVEESPLMPNSPYSASKAAADMMVRAYEKTYGLPVNITRCSNNYGPYQFPEKLIPLMIYNAQKGKKLPLYGDGRQIRDWIHVKDHCEAILKVLEKGKNGEIYNIGSNQEKANIEIVRLILQILNQSEDLIEYVKNRPKDDRRYAIDNTKIIKELGWQPSYNFKQGIKETVAWYLEQKKWLTKVVNGEYQNYYRDYYQK